MAGITQNLSDWYDRMAPNAAVQFSEAPIIPGGNSWSARSARRFLQSDTASITAGVVGHALSPTGYHAAFGGAAQAFGFAPAMKYSSVLGRPMGMRQTFMGGAGLKRGLFGMAGAVMALGVGAASGTPMGELAGFLAAPMAAKAMAGSAAMKSLGVSGFTLSLPVMTAFEIIRGYREGGIGGALEAGASNAAMMAAANFGMSAITKGGVFSGTTLGAFGHGIKMLGPVLGIAAAVGYGAYKVGKYMAEYGRGTRRSEFAGSTASFMTGAAYTMRQRAMQEISRSHSSSRLLLGNEAQYMHIR